jgi:hypothetical protein
MIALAHISNEWNQKELKPSILRLKTREIDHINLESVNKLIDETISIAGQKIIASIWKSMPQTSRHTASYSVLQRADSFVKKIDALIAALPSGWGTPAVSPDFDGSVAFEWVRGQKQLILSIFANQTISLRTWGTDIFDEMEENDIQNPADFVAQLSWLREA